QTKNNYRKLKNIWVIEDNIKLLSEYVISKITEPKTGICHGSRRGLEQEWFMKYIPGCNVMGTEISPSAENFPNTIKWDFHDVKPEWKRAIDFIYSNALDHSYNPEMCLSNWMYCLKENGICFIEHSTQHGKGVADEVDPFRASIDEIPVLIDTWGAGLFSIVDIINPVVLPECVSAMSVFVIRNMVGRNG
ncbi:hypothetical protein, partial [Sulfuricurvum sp.]|uniref:hypothetical protein n=1 Tax=Sulfuricurvum sp. TaxID=2025608 RepID=UPI0035678DCF